MKKFLVLINVACIVSLQANSVTYDVLVYGATASGVMAAIAASEEGSRAGRQVMTRGMRKLPLTSRKTPDRGYFWAPGVLVRGIGRQ